MRPLQARRLRQHELRVVADARQRRADADDLVVGLGEIAADAIRQVLMPVDRHEEVALAERRHLCGGAEENIDRGGLAGLHFGPKLARDPRRIGARREIDMDGRTEFFFDAVFEELRRRGAAHHVRCPTQREMALVVCARDELLQREIDLRLIRTGAVRWLKKDHNRGDDRASDATKR
jgi:hypothetical protein